MNPFSRICPLFPFPAKQNWFIGAIIIIVCTCIGGDLGAAEDVFDVKVKRILGVQKDLKVGTTEFDRAALDHFTRISRNEDLVKAIFVAGDRQGLDTQAIYSRSELTFIWLASEGPVTRSVRVLVVVDSNWIPKKVVTASRTVTAPPEKDTSGAERIIDDFQELKR